MRKKLFPVLRLTNNSCWSLTNAMEGFISHQEHDIVSAVVTAADHLTGFGQFYILIKIKQKTTNH